MNRITAIITSFMTVMLLLLSASGCLTSHDESDASSSPATTTAIPTTSGKNVPAAPFTLAYSSKDTLNPFTAKTSANLQLCSLLYEGLIRLDGTLTPKPALAASVDDSVPASLTAILRSGARFSDGSAITPDDVTESFRLAKKSSGFKVLLSNVKSAKSKDGKVVFELDSPDPNAAACLTFPVIKSGTDSAPVGSGRYVYKAGASPVLNANSRNAAKAGIKTIRLLDITHGEAMLYALESGSISYYYTDLSGGNIPRTSNASIRVPLNSVVFIGVNSRRTALSKKEARQAISSAVDRTEISASAFAGRARPAVSPFNPSWSSAVELKGFEKRGNIPAAVAQLKLAGYNNKSTGNKTISPELLVSNGNSFRDATAELLKEQLAKAGIKLTIVKDSFKNVVKKLKSGDFDLYIGEVLLPFNMSLAPFLIGGGNASYGIHTQGESAEAYQGYLNGEITLQEFTDIFKADVPYIPLCWRDGMAAYNRALSGVSPTAFDLFYGLENWVYS